MTEETWQVKGERCNKCWSYKPNSGWKNVTGYSHTKLQREWDQFFQLR